MTSFFIFFFIVNRWKFITRPSTGNVLMHETVCSDVWSQTRVRFQEASTAFSCLWLVMMFCRHQQPISSSSAIKSVTAFTSKTEFLIWKVHLEEPTEENIDKQTRTYANHGSSDPFSYLPSSVCLCLWRYRTKRSDWKGKCLLNPNRVVQGRNKMSRAVRIKGLGNKAG